MTQYNSLNVKLSNSQLNKLNSGIKNKTEIVLRLSWNIIGNSDDETNFPHKLLSTNRQVGNLRKAFANNSSTDISCQKLNYFRWYNQEDIFGRVLVPLLKTGLPLIKYVITPLAKSVLIPLGLTAAASAAILASGHPSDSASHTTTPIISNNEMKDIMKRVKSLEDSCLLLKGVSKTIQNEAKEKKEDYVIRYIKR